jgi:hypothetical protein
MMTQRSATFISHRSEIDTTATKRLNTATLVTNAIKSAIRQTIERRTGVKQ